MRSLSLSVSKFYVITQTIYKHKATGFTLRQNTCSPFFSDHTRRLLRPDVWELHAPHVFLRLFAHFHLGEFLTCKYQIKMCL